MPKIDLTFETEFILTSPRLGATTIRTSNLRQFHTVLQMQDRIDPTCRMTVVMASYYADVSEPFIHTYITLVRSTNAELAIDYQSSAPRQARAITLALHNQTYLRNDIIAAAAYCLRVLVGNVPDDCNLANLDQWIEN